MKIYRSDRRWMITYGAFFTLSQLSFAHSNALIKLLDIFIGLVAVLLGLLPLAVLSDDRIAIRRFLLLSRTIALHEIATVEFKTVSRHSPREVLLRESSGKTTSLLPSKPDDLLRFLAERIPSAFAASSSGIAPPPLPAALSVPSTPWYSRTSTLIKWG